MKLRTDLLMRIGILIVILILCLAIYMNGKDLSCNKCEIKLTTDARGMGGPDPDAITEIRVDVIDLFKSIEDDNCILTWSHLGWSKSQNLTI